MENRMAYKRVTGEERGEIEALPRWAQDYAFPCAFKGIPLLGRMSRTQYRVLPKTGISACF